MSTTIAIQVGPLTGSVVYQDDAKTAEVLRRYYLYMDLGPANATNQQMLDAIVRSVAREMSRYAVEHYIGERRIALEQQLRDEAEVATDFIGNIT